MEYSQLNVKKIHILRIDPGEDVLLSVHKFLAESGLRQAVVLGGYGTLAAYRLHWVNDNRIPSGHFILKGEGGFEILSMNGLVVDGKPHIHATFSSSQGAFGGHVEDGCTAYVLCELFFAEVEGMDLAYRRVPVQVEGMGSGLVSRLTFDGGA